MIKTGPSLLSGALSSFFIFALVSVFVLPMASCTTKHKSIEELEASIIKDLPAGTKKVEVEGYLSQRGIDYSEGILKPISREDLRLYKTIVGSIDVDSWFFSNSKIVMEFYFDDNQQLVRYEIKETYSSL